MSCSTISEPISKHVSKPQGKEDGKDEKNGADRSFHYAGAPKGNRRRDQSFGKPDPSGSVVEIGKGSAGNPATRYQHCQREHHSTKDACAKREYQLYQPL